MSEAFNQAQFIADRFGGRPVLAEAIDVPAHQVDYWCRVTKFIPEKHRPRVLQEAIRLQVDVTAFDFIRHLVSVPAAAVG